MTIRSEKRGFSCTLSPLCLSPPSATNRGFQTRRGQSEGLPTTAPDCATVVGRSREAQRGPGRAGEERSSKSTADLLAVVFRLTTEVGRAPTRALHLRTPTGTSRGRKRAPQSAARSPQGRQKYKIFQEGLQPQPRPLRHSERCQRPVRSAGNVAASLSTSKHRRLPTSETEPAWDSATLRMDSTECEERPGIPLDFQALPVA